MIQDEDGTPCWSTAFPKEDGYYWCSFKPGGCVSGDFVALLHAGALWVTGEDRSRSREVFDRGDIAYWGPIELPYKPDWDRLIG